MMPRSAIERSFHGANSGTRNYNTIVTTGASYKFYEMVDPAFSIPSSAARAREHTCFYKTLSQWLAVASQ